jgi:hypothetical protein
VMDLEWKVLVSLDNRHVAFFGRKWFFWLSEETALTHSLLSSTVYTQQIPRNEFMSVLSQFKPLPLSLPRPQLHRIPRLQLARRPVRRIPRRRRTHRVARNIRSGAGRQFRNRRLLLLFFRRRQRWRRLGVSCPAAPSVSEEEQDCETADGDDGAEAEADAETEVEGYVGVGGGGGRARGGRCCIGGCWCFVPGECGAWRTARRFCRSR